MTVLYLIIGALIAGFAGGWQVQDWRAGAAENERKAAAIADFRRGELKVDGAAYQQEQVREVIRDQFHYIDREVTHAIQTDFYAAGAPACLDPDGVRIVNDSARPPAPAASEPAHALPGVRAPAGWLSRFRAGVDEGHGPDVPRVPGQAP